jgi:ATP-dependent Clp protease ATP-binding subunit ClpA
MFELYTEKSRRVIFFARYEASGLGSEIIESQHLLLGLMRESKPLFDSPRFPPGSREELRKRIEEQTKKLPPTATSLDLPLAKESKRILAYAAEESQRLGHPFIGTEHILLGILREQESLAANLLSEYGLTPDEYRQEIQEAEKIGRRLDAKELPQKIAPPIGWKAGPSPLPLSPEGFRVLAFAIEEAEALGQTKVGAEHLVLGILRREDTPMANMLREKGLNAWELRQKLEQAQEGGGAE